MAGKLHKAIADPRKFADNVDAYIKQCLQKDDSGKDMLISIVGLAVYLGTYKQRLHEWIERYKEPTEHDPDCLIADSLKRAKAASELQLQQDCYRNRNAMSLALAKCMYSYVEQQHVKHEHSGGVSMSVDFGFGLGKDSDKKA